MHTVKKFILDKILPFWPFLESFVASQHCNQSSVSKAPAPEIHQCQFFPRSPTFSSAWCHSVLEIDEPFLIIGEFAQWLILERELFHLLQYKSPSKLLVAQLEHQRTEKYSIATFQVASVISSTVLGLSSTANASLKASQDTLDNNHPTTQNVLLDKTIRVKAGSAAVPCSETTITCFPSNFSVSKRLAHSNLHSIFWISYDISTTPLGNMADSDCYWYHVSLSVGIYLALLLETRSSWLNCVLRDDEAVYWVSIGHYEAVAVGNWWCWVSRGHSCLYILQKVEIRCYRCLTDWLTHSLTHIWKIGLLSSL